MSMFNTDKSQDNRKDIKVNNPDEPLTPERMNELAGILRAKCEDTPTRLLNSLCPSPCYGTPDIEMKSKVTPPPFPLDDSTTNKTDSIYIFDHYSKHSSETSYLWDS